MTATTEQAVDDIFGVLRTAWLAANHGYPMFWSDIEQDSIPSTTPWARAAIFHDRFSQASLGRPALFRRTGYLQVQIFSPIGDGLQTARQLAKIVTDAYEGVDTPRGVWFRDVRPREVGRDGGFQRIDVTVDFQYDEVK